MQNTLPPLPDTQTVTNTLQDQLPGRCGVSACLRQARLDLNCVPLAHQLLLPSPQPPFKCDCDEQAKGFAAGFSLWVPFPPQS